MKFIGIIPARYASTRFPGKPLAMLGGKPVIQRVYEQVDGILDAAIVATDDERIEAAVKSFGGRVVMTSTEHKSGTDRCAEAYEKLGSKADIVINVQGDEPFIDPRQIAALVGCFEDASIDIATLIKPITAEDGVGVLDNPNTPKVVISRDMKALYFSRTAIPYLRGVEREAWPTQHTYYKHIGMYAFRSQTLGEVTAIAQTPLELGEKLEQLRWLESGYRIGVAVTDIETIGIDTPEDLERAKELASKRKNVLFGGRLAQYTYADMDDTIAAALEMSKKIFNPQNN
mgnify:CR=1 FL=1